MLCTDIVSDIQNNFCTQHVLPMFCKKKSFWQRFTCISYILGFIMQSLISFWSFQIKKNLNFPWKSSTLGKFKFPFWIKWLHASNFDYFFNTVIHTYSWREPEKFLNRFDHTSQNWPVSPIKYFFEILIFFMQKL